MGGDGNGGSDGDGGTTNGSGGNDGSGGNGNTTGCSVTATVLMDDAELPYQFTMAEPFTPPDNTGTWGTYGDEGGSSSISQVEAERAGGGTYARSCSGSDFNDWGGGCLARFGGDVIDLAAHGLDGFQFWARASAPVSVRVNFLDSGSHTSGGRCVDTSESCTEDCCYDHYGFIAEIGVDWELYRISFDDLWREDNNGPPGPFDPTAIYGMDFRGPVDTTFQFDLDDLAFITCD